MAQTDRDVLFANEAFVVGMLQAVSGGAVVAALAQSDSLVKWAGRTSFLLLVTAALLALGLAVLAAYWRHQYKMWDVKAQASSLTALSRERPTTSVSGVLAAVSTCVARNSGPALSVVPEPSCPYLLPTEAVRQHQAALSAPTTAQPKPEPSSTSVTPVSG